MPTDTSVAALRAEDAWSETDAHTGQPTPTDTSIAALRAEHSWSETDAHTGQPAAAAAATKSTVDFNHFSNDTQNPNIEPASGIQVARQEALELYAANFEK